MVEKNDDTKFLHMLMDECRKAEEELKRIIKELDSYNYPVKKDVN